jgi:peptide chain release factor
MIKLLVTSGRGPVECRIAVARVLDRIAREADAAGVGCDAALGPDPDGEGPASALVILSGDGAGSVARRWIGSVLWVAQSSVRQGHKRKNWYVGVMALPIAPIALKAVALSDVRFEAFRAGGPGGQHQNKTESAVRAVHVPTGLAVVAREERSQHRNKAMALERLAALIKAGGELTAALEQQRAHASHDKLERGNPVRRFVGAKFTED